MAKYFCEGYVKLERRVATKVLDHFLDFIWGLQPPKVVSANGHQRRCFETL